LRIRGVAPSMPWAAQSRAAAVSGSMSGSYGGLDAVARPPDDPGMQPDEDLGPRERERARRRDRAASAEDRDLLRPGMGKVFKQIQDAQRKAADATPEPARRRRTRDGA